MHNENRTFEEIGSFSVHEKKQQTALCILFLLIAGAGTGIIFWAKVYANNSVPIWTIILSVIGFIVVHELIHIVFMSIFSKGKIKVCIKVSTIAVGSDAYFNRTQYIVIALAPVVVLGIISLICLLTLPYKLLFSILSILNYATASGDYVLTYHALKQAKNTYFVDTAEKTMLYIQSY